MKQPFDIDAVLERVREAVRFFPKPALFALAEEGFTSPFEQLVACIISIRTLDEITEPTARRLFRRARTPADLSQLPLAELEHLIRDASFPEAKAAQIQAIARRVVTEYGGTLPCDRAVLLSFHGVGPKCANLVLGIACGQPYIAVDTHVHRIVNRWGYVHTRTPEQTLAALEAQLPRAYWLEINRLLVPFGKRICTPVRPRCSACPVRPWCRQVGVTEPR